MSLSMLSCYLLVISSYPDTWQKWLLDVGIKRKRQGRARVLSFARSRWRALFAPVWGSAVPTQSWFCVPSAGRAASVCFTFSVQSVWLNICCLCDSSARHLPGKANQHNPSCRRRLEQTGASGRFWADAGTQPALNPNFPCLNLVTQCPAGSANQLQSGGEWLREFRKMTHGWYVNDLPFLWALSLQWVWADLLQPLLVPKNICPCQGHTCGCGYGTSLLWGHPTCCCPKVSPPTSHLLYFHNLILWGWT